MNRTQIVVSVGLVLIGLVLWADRPTSGGCHGGCITRSIAIAGPGGDATPPPCNPGVARSDDHKLGTVLLDAARMGGDPATDLELWQIPLDVGDKSFSGIFSNEATTFYVASGVVTFDVDTAAASGTVRVVGSSNATPEATAGGEHVVAAGGALFVDGQVVDGPDERLTVGYRNGGSEEAMLVISSAVPCASAAASLPAG